MLVEAGRQTKMNAKQSPKNSPGAGTSERIFEREAWSLTVDNGRVDSRDLLGDRREIVIVHGDVEYHLRLTAQSKLILTK